MGELEEVRRERDGHQAQTEQLRRELNSLRSQLEETEWSLCQKSGMLRKTIDSTVAPFHFGDSELFMVFSALRLL